MLGRLFELLEVVLIFLDWQHTADVHQDFQSEGFHLSLSYLVDFLVELYSLFLKIQRKTSTFSSTTTSFKYLWPKSTANND